MKRTAIKKVSVTKIVELTDLDIEAIIRVHVYAPPHSAFSWDRNNGVSIQWTDASPDEVSND